MKEQASTKEYNTGLVLPDNILFRGHVDFIELTHLIREQKDVFWVIPFLSFFLVIVYYIDS